MSVSIDPDLSLGAGAVSAYAPTAAGGFSPITLTNADAASFAYGEIGYLFGNGSVKKAQADGTLAEAAASVICVNTGGVASSATGSFVFGGVVDTLSGGTAGALAYLSATAGAITSTPNTTSGQFNVILGTYVSTTALSFAPQLPILN